jgi:hypothetical protein
MEGFLVAQCSGWTGISHGYRQSSETEPSSAFLRGWMMRCLRAEGLAPRFC